MSEEALQAGVSFKQAALPDSVAHTVLDSPRNKRPALNNGQADAANHKRPRVAASIIHNTAPQRRTRIGPQYQAEIPPWPSAGSGSKPALPHSGSQASYSAETDR